MKTMKMALLGLLMTAGPALAGGHASGDATAGEKVFKKCKACHAIVADDGTAIVKGGRNAPNLYGIYDRQAAVRILISKSTANHWSPLALKAWFGMKPTLSPTLQIPKSF